MAISLGVYPIFRHTHIKDQEKDAQVDDKILDQDGGCHILWRVDQGLQVLKPKKVRWPRYGRRLRRSSELPNRSLSRKEVQSILKRRRNDCHRHHRYIIKNQQIHVQMFQVETLASVLLGFALWTVRVNVGIKHHPTSAKIPKTGHLPTVHIHLRRVAMGPSLIAATTNSTTARTANRTHTHDKFTVVWHKSGIVVTIGEMMQACLGARATCAEWNLIWLFRCSLVAPWEKQGRRA